jgi:hypothetical protein
MRSALTLSLALLGILATLSCPLNAQVEVSPVVVLPDVESSIEVVQTIPPGPAIQCYQGDVWEVSTRHLPCCINRSLIAQPNFRVYHIEEGCWKARKAEDLFEATAQVDGEGFAPLTIYYVHGNWMTEENTRERIQTINRALSRSATRPYRLVGLSWPSEREPGFVSYIRENAVCADVQAHYLA